MTNRRRWTISLSILALFAACAFAAAMFLSKFLAEPAFRSLDELDPSQVSQLSVWVINRPDDGPEIRAGAELLAVPNEDVPAILASLKGGTPITEKRTVYLGRLAVLLTDGRKLEVILHRDATSPKLQYRIEKYSYELPDAAPFLKALDAMETKMKKS